MALNYIWISFFLVGLLVAIIRYAVSGVDMFTPMVDSTFSMAETSFEIAIGLTGILCLWLGIMKIGEQAGAVRLLAKLVGPFFNKLFPSVPEDHPARGSMLMNFSANMLGLDNAATPMGLKAMNELQDLNQAKDRASDAMIMFLVLNTSGLTLIPVAVMNYRNISGAESPSDIFLPILISTFFASLIGLIVVAIYQKINLLNKVVLAYLGGMTLLVAGLIYWFYDMPPDEMQTYSSLLSNVIIYGIICGFIIMAIRKRVNVYETFIEGAKEGFDIAIKIIPFLVAILVSIGVFRESGAFEYLIDGFRWFFGIFTDNTSFVEALPTAFMKPLSGTGARGMMLESFAEHGVDSYVGKMTSTLQGATDTTFYIIAVYFGAVGIRKTRYAITAGLLADLGGIIAGIIVATIFFGHLDTGPQMSAQETVNGFASSWEQKDPQSAELFLSEDSYIIDVTHDTLAHNRGEIVSIVADGPSAEVISVVETEETFDVDGRSYPIVYLKMRSSNEEQTIDYGYEIVVKHEEIVRIKKMGIIHN